MSELHFWGISNSGFHNDFYPSQPFAHSIKWMTERVADDRTVSTLLFRRNWMNRIDVWNDSCAITWLKQTILTNGTDRPGYTAASLYCRTDQMNAASRHEAIVKGAVDVCLQKQRLAFNENDFVQHPPLNLTGVANPKANKYQAEDRKTIVLCNAGTALSLERLLNILPKLKHRNYSLFLVQDALNTDEKDELQNRLSKEEVSFIDGQNNLWNSLKSVLIELIPGCTDPNALNYNPAANVDNGSCVAKVLGCTDPEASNYMREANKDDGSCKYEVFGCMDSRAANFNPKANVDDGSCLYSQPPLPPQTQPPFLKRVIPFMLIAIVFGLIGYSTGRISFVDNPIIEGGVETGDSPKPDITGVQKPGKPEVEPIPVELSQHILDSLMADFRPPSWEERISYQKIDEEMVNSFRVWVNSTDSLQQLFGSLSTHECDRQGRKESENLKASYEAWEESYEKKEKVFRQEYSLGSANSDVDKTNKESRPKQKVDSVLVGDTSALDPGEANIVNE